MIEDELNTIDVIDQLIWGAKINIYHKNDKILRSISKSHSSCFRGRELFPPYIILGEILYLGQYSENNQLLLQCDPIKADFSTGQESSCLFLLP